MRSPFNTHCEIFAGPGTSTPGVSRGVFSCRLVIEDGIHSQQLDPGQPWIPSYLTIEAYRPKGMFNLPKYSLSSGLADRVAVPATGPVNYLVFYTDYIRWKKQKKYYRSYLIEIPSPDIAFGGVIVDGLAVVSPGHTVTTGGVACGGTSEPILVTVGGGGVKIGGQAIVIPGSSLFLSGGVIIGGIATYIPGPAKSIGGVLVGGSASVVPGTAFSAVGGVLLGGAASVVPGGAFLGKGGLLLGGDATVVPGKTFVSTARVLLGGGGSWSPHASGLIDSTDRNLIGAQMHTVPDHGLSTGDSVTISGMTSYPVANGSWTITVVSNVDFVPNGCPNDMGGVNPQTPVGHYTSP